jgi:putative flippase GtrA
MSRRFGQPLRFVLVGSGGYVLNLVAFAALFAAGVRYLAASILAYFLSNAGMYLGNRYFTFGLGRDGFWADYVRYVLVGVTVAGLTAALLAAMVERAGIDPRIGQALSLAAVTPLAFLLSKRWSFQPRPA